MNKTEIDFDRNQKDLTLTDAKVHWMGASVELYSQETGASLAFMTVANGPVIEKIKVWCVKNNYRCSQVQGDKILL